MESARLQSFEQKFFRALNSVVEPGVRRGVGSSRLLPASLVVLETVGFKSGLTRRTPLWSLRFGRYRIISTARGERSFWIKNLQRDPEVHVYVGGRRRAVNATVFAGGEVMHAPGRWSRAVAALASSLQKLSRRGWTFALLGPAKR